MTNEKLYDCVTWYAVENWESLVKNASPCITKEPKPISVQLGEYFNISESVAGKIARDVAIMKNTGIF